MNHAASLAFHAFHLGLLRGASFMVPATLRRDWYREWIGELWHVRRDCQPVGAFSFTAERELTAFCLGSFKDAACLRAQAASPTVPVASASVHGSARQCILWLSAVLALCVLVARFLPGILSGSEAAHAALPAGVIVVERGEFDHSGIPFAQYRDWRSRPQRFFSDLAFYTLSRETVQGTGIPDADWQVAHATANAAPLLGATALASEPPAGTPRALLSSAMWRVAFASDPNIIGTDITIANRAVRIVGIAPAGARLLPGQPDLWLLGDTARAARTPRSSQGHVIAALSPLGRAELSGGLVDIAVYGPNGDETIYRGLQPTSYSAGPVAIFLFALLLAVLALPAITSVFQSESAFSSHRPSLRARIRRGLFLTAKIALVIAIGCFAALDLAYWNSPNASAAAEFLQFAASFTMCLFGLRWALVDQSRRCPVCLRRVTHPAQVGVASCTFLGWNGTEMICTGGHALLHVPSAPTSWFSGQRWMYLDTSWDFLFAETPHPY